MVHALFLATEEAGMERSQFEGMLGPQRTFKGSIDYAAGLSRTKGPGV